MENRQRSACLHSYLLGLRGLGSSLSPGLLLRSLGSLGLGSSLSPLFHLPVVVKKIGACGFVCELRGGVGWG